MTDASHTLTPRGILSDDGRPWVTVHTRPGYIDLDSHGLPRPLNSVEARHLARRLDLAADALDEHGPVVPRLMQGEAA